MLVVPIHAKWMSGLCLPYLPGVPEIFGTPGLVLAPAEELEECGMHPLLSESREVLPTWWQASASGGVECECMKK